MNLEEWIQFDGRVYARSSKEDASGPPGEIEIGNLNPERATMIRSKSGWPTVEPGTLNVKVDERDVHMLATLRPAFSEFAPKYPEKYASIPARRIGYWYYDAEITARKGKPFKTPKRVLLRRAINPSKGVIEIIAPVNIRNKWKVKEGDTLTIKATTHVDAADAAIFTTRTGKAANIIGQWHDAAAFLVMNGPSLNTIDRGPLKFVHSMCVNNGPKALMPKLRPSMWTFVDGADKFLYTIWNDPTIMKFAPVGSKHKPLWNSDTNLPAGIKVEQCPNVTYFERNTAFNPDTFLTEPSVNWGNSKKAKDENGRRGCRSVMMAAIKILYLAGFRRIYLIGCDFNMSPESKYAFPQDRKESAIKNNQSTYAQLDWRFNRMKQHFADNGLSIFNCNPTSGLTAFPFMAYEDALADALRYVHDWKAYIHGKLEATAGLYESKWYVCPTCNSNARYAKEEIIGGGIKCACGFQLTEDNRRKHLKDQSQAGIES